MPEQRWIRVIIGFVGAAAICALGSCRQRDIGSEDVGTMPETGPDAVVDREPPFVEDADGDALPEDEEESPLSPEVPSDLPADIGPGDGDDPIGNPICGAEVEVLDLNRIGTPTAPNGLTYSGVNPGGEGRFVSLAGTGQGREVVFSYTPDLDGDLVVDTFGSHIDTVLYVRTDCQDPASEIAYNDDSGSLSGPILSQVEVRNGAMAERTIFLFVDTVSAENTGEFTVTARVRRVVHRGEECDPDGLATRCAEGSACGPAGVCVDVHPPEVSQVWALVLDDPGDEIRFIARGSDADGDAQGLRIAFFDRSGAPLRVEGRDHIQVDSDVRLAGLTEFTAHADVSGFAEFPEAAAADIRIVDAQGLSSEPMHADFVPLPRPAMGEPCDPDRLFDRCVLGAICDASSRCVPGMPPVLSELQAWWIETGLRLIVMTGSDAEGDVTRYRVTFVNAEGAPVSDDLFHDLTLDFDDSVLGRTAFRVGAHVRTLNPFTGEDLLPRDAVGVRVNLVDAGMGESNAMIAHFADIPRIEGGEACDPLGLDNRCTSGLVCWPPGPPSTCRDPREAAVEACRRDLPDLTSGIPATGTLSGLGVFTGTCGGRGPEAIHRLILSSRSRVVLTTDLPGTPDQADTVLYVRRDCADDTSEPLEACNDDVEPHNGASRLDLTLDRGTYYVFVDTFLTGTSYEVLATVTPL